jgi:hypothetical protein
MNKLEQLTEQLDRSRHRTESNESKDWASRTELAAVSQSPGEYGAALGQCRSVVVAKCNLGNRILWDLERQWGWGALLSATVAELTAHRTTFWTKMHDTNQ